MRFKFGSDSQGKYDDIATTARDAAGADLVAVLVIGGNKGSGFTVQTNSARLVSILPDALEGMAAQIREEMKAKMQ